MLEGFTWFKQSALRWQGDVTLYVDPWGIPAGQPRGDVVLITHAHFDHFSEADLDAVRGEDTILLAPQDVASSLASKGDVRSVAPGTTMDVRGISLECVPAYNLKPERQQFHPRENNWVGYILSLGGSRYYLAGDTDHTPELSAVRADVCFVPIGGTYTMDAEEAAVAVKEIGPKVAVPYHYGFVVGGRADGERFVKLVAPVEGRILTPVNPFERE